MLISLVQVYLSHQNVSHSKLLMQRTINNANHETACFCIALGVWNRDTVGSTNNIAIDGNGV
jgi:hypothetical protein